MGADHNWALEVILLPILNAEVETCLRDILIGDGYSVSPQRAHGETGVDIVATRHGESWHIMPADESR